MAIYTTIHADGVAPMPIPLDQAVVAERMPFAVTETMSSGDLIEIGPLPADCVPIDLIVDQDAMGTGATCSVGLLNEAGDDLAGDAWTTDADVAAAGASRADDAGLRAMARVSAGADNRRLAIKLTSATTATSGELAVTLLYRAS